MDRRRATGGEQGAWEVKRSLGVTGGAGGGVGVRGGGAGLRSGVPLASGPWGMRRRWRRKRRRRRAQERKVARDRIADATAAAVDRCPVECQLIMSLLFTPYVEFFMESFTSRLNTERFCVNLSLFLVSRFRSMPSIRFSKHKCMACCFSGGWLLTMLFLKSAKYFSFNKIKPSSGRDMDH